MEFRYSFNSIVILQWLDKQDDQTGTELEAYLQPLCREARINLAFVNVSSAAEFRQALDLVVRDAVRLKASPILHIETHGTPEGVCASTRERVRWAELAPSLRALNRHSRMNLLVTMAACHGFNLIRTLPDAGDGYPVWGLIGPDEQVLPSDVRRGFQAFFTSLLRDLDLSRALDALRDGDWSWPESWRIEFAETFLSWTHAHYLRELTEEALQQREDKIVAEGARRGLVGTPDRLRALREGTGNHELIFKMMRQKVLMLDLFPENEERFPLSYDDVLRANGIDHASLPRARPRPAV